jgi:hypothetical protein
MEQKKTARSSVVLVSHEDLTIPDRMNLAEEKFPYLEENIPVASLPLFSRFDLAQQRVKTLYCVRGIVWSYLDTF